MRLIIFIAAFAMMLTAQAFAKINVYVSVLPQKYFVESIGKEKVDVNVMVMPGANPATYEPKPKQMVDLSKTDIYFSIGAPFEMHWLNKFISLNKDMTIIRTDKGLAKRTMEKHVHEEGKQEDHHEDDNAIKDPHVWLDPILVAQQAKVITKALCDADTINCPYYTANLTSFNSELETLDNKIKAILNGHEESPFMVFHPSWGYFADRYNLHQIPVELEGKEPKPSDLKEFIKLVRSLKLKTIFIQPQFSRKAAELIAHETGANVVAVDPLSPDWANNLIYATNQIAKSF